jgi:hypothetical protein
LVQLDKDRGVAWGQEVESVLETAGKMPDLFLPKPSRLMPVKINLKLILLEPLWSVQVEWFCKLQICRLSLLGNLRVLHSGKSNGLLMLEYKLELIICRKL